MDSWMRSIRWEHPFSWMEREVFGFYRRAVNEQLRDKETRVACNPNQEDHIIGWSAGNYIQDSLVVHFIWVKRLYRRNGIGRDLFEALKPEQLEGLIYYTHHTPIVTKCKLREKWGITYNPMLI